MSLIKPIKMLCSNETMLVPLGLFWSCVILIFTMELLSLLYMHVFGDDRHLDFKTGKHFYLRKLCLCCIELVLMFQDCKAATCLFGQVIVESLSCNLSITFDTKFIPLYCFKTFSLSIIMLPFSSILFMLSV